MSKVIYISLFLPLGFGVLPSLAHAVPAGGTGADTIHIDEVEIVHSMPIGRGAAISAGMDTLSMELMAGRSLSELLALQPAVHLKSAGRGALSTASFRGMDASHTKVYWNGIRLNSPMLGQVDLSLLPVWIVDEMSLLYGGSSLREGSGALGGAVMLENSMDWNGSLSLSLNQEIASFGTLGTAGSISMGDDRIRSDTRLFWNRSHNDYPFLNTDILPAAEQRLEQAGYSRGGILQEISLRPGNHHELSLRLWYQEAGRELPPLMSQEGASRDESQEDRNLRTSVEWKMYRGFGTISVRSAWSGNRLNYHLYHNNLEYSQFDSESEENSLYNTLMVDMNAGERSRLQFRADYNRHDAGIRDLVRDEGYQHLRNEGSIMLAAYRKAGRRWTLYMLLRQDWAEGNRLPVMPSAGFRYHILKNRPFYLKGNLSRNYNLPSLNDLYWIPGGNPDLRPENSISGDLSVEFSIERSRMALHGSAHAFAAWVEDWILWKPTRFRYWEAENLGTVFSRGLDLQLGSDIHMGEWLLTLKAGYAYTRSTNEESLLPNDQSRGAQLIYIPVHSSSGYLNLARSGYSLNWSVNYTGSRFTQPSSEIHDFTEVLNPYTLHDIHLGKSWNIRQGKAGLRFSIYNLFNISYQAIRSRPMPMRNYALTLKLQI